MTRYPGLDWLRITKRKSGAIQLTPLDPQPEPRNLRRLKKAIRDRWGQVPLIDMVTEAALRTGMLGQLTAVGPREALARAVLWERSLLLAYAYGTNTGISAVAAGGHGHSEAELRYTARRHFTIDGARAVAIQLANATFAARPPATIAGVTSSVPVTTMGETRMKSAVAQAPSLPVTSAEQSRLKWLDAGHIDDMTLYDATIAAEIAKGPMILTSDTTTSSPGPTTSAMASPAVNTGTCWYGNQNQKTYWDIFGGQ